MIFFQRFSDEPWPHCVRVEYSKEDLLLSGANDYYRERYAISYSGEWVRGYDINMNC
jgi:hypothetical protein